MMTFVNAVRGTLFVGLVWSGQLSLPAAERTGDQAQILIRPANYDPADEWEYSRLAGELKPGMRADGPIWNRPKASELVSAEPEAGPALQLVAGQAEDEPAPAPEVEPVAPPATEPAPGTAEPATVPENPPVTPGVAGPSAITYGEAYNASPFSRTEYEANPSYRHDAALEIMFGTARPTTIIRQSAPQVNRYPDFCRLPVTIHTGYHRYGWHPYGYYGSTFYGYPNSPFGYPYGLRSPP